MPPVPATLLLIAALLPLVSFGVLVFLGKRMGNPFAGYVASAAIAGSFALSMAAMFYWYAGGVHVGREWGFGKAPIVQTLRWIPVGGNGIVAGQPGAQAHTGYLDLGIYVDSLTMAMFAMITLVATLVHVFSIGYMRDDQRFPRFFTYLGLFCFSMLGLVVGGTALQLFIFWELVGVCSYLLIGFWYEKKSASNAALKAFVTNRIGDVGFLIGFGILFYHLGNATLPDMWIALGSAGNGQSITLPNGFVFSSALLTIMGIGLFFGAIGKSAQFPLHVWLPDAMEGPTPVSALIHAATMVAAGVYLVGRIFPLLTPDAKLFIAIIGATTLTMAALIALAQSDIKKVLAYSTLSQLGYMILAMGVGSWVGGLFHLITHAFFKALLFLGSGSVIHATHDEQDMTQYGGLWRKIPITAVTFGVAALAIAGTPFLSGSYSKAMILTHAAAVGYGADAAHLNKLYWLLFILPAVIAYITAFYMTRCWMLTFAGKPRNKHLHEQAHESPILWLPLVVLAGMTIVAGWSGFTGIPELIKQSMVEATRWCESHLPSGTRFMGFAYTWPDVEHHNEAGPAQGEEAVATGEALAGVHPLIERAEHLEHTWAYWAFAVGIGLGVLVYSRGYAIPNMLLKVAPIRWIHAWLYRRMYIDELYNVLFVSITLGLSRLSAWLDRTVVDGLVNGAASVVRRIAEAAGLHDEMIIDGAVNGAGRVATSFGNAVRNPTSGRVRVYIAALMVAVAIGVAGVLIGVVVLS